MKQRLRYLRYRARYLAGLLGGLAMSLLATPAGAQPGGAPAGPAAAQAAWPAVPVGATTDRLGTERIAAGIDLGLSVPDEGDADLILHVDIHGQLLTDISAGLVGGYLALPIGYMSFDDTSESSLGNLELGAAFVPAALPVPVVLRAGLALDTVDNEIGPAVHLISGRGRTTDLVTQVSGATWLRLGVSPTLRSGKLFARLDLGLDVPVAKEEFSGVNSLVRLNIAGGADLGVVAVMGELAIVGSTDSDILDDRYLSTFAVTARATHGTIQPFGSIVLPLDENVRDVIPVVLTAGLRVAFTPG